MGFMRGGRKVAGLCGMENVRWSIWRPIRDKASSLEGRVKELGVKVRRVRVNKCGVATSQHSEFVRRRAQMEVVSRCESRFVRNLSSRQRRRKAGLAVAIACACRQEKEPGCGWNDNQINVDSQRGLTRGVLMCFWKCDEG